MLNNLLLLYAGGFALTLAYQAFIYTRGVRGGIKGERDERIFSYVLAISTVIGAAVIWPLFWGSYIYAIVQGVKRDRER